MGVMPDDAGGYHSQKDQSDQHGKPHFHRWPRHRLVTSMSWRWLPARHFHPNLHGACFGKGEDNRKALACCQRRLQANQHHVHSTRSEPDAAAGLDRNSPDMPHDRQAAFLLGCVNLGRFRRGRRDADQAVSLATVVPDTHINRTGLGDRWGRTRPRMFHGKRSDLEVMR